MPKLYTVKALAELFDKKEETIREWIRDGDVFPNAFRIRDGWYVPASDVNKLMKKDGTVEKAGAVRRSSKGFTVREW